ncbi:MAG: SAM-dependent methyltransferase [Clostridia bacterium]
MNEAYRKSLNLDQYYTQKHIAEKCLNVLKDVVATTSRFDNSIFLEPSAGTGSFIDATNKIFKNRKIVAFDIDPKHPDVKKRDFLKVDIRDYSNVITIGNPPFGNRSSLAIDFFNRAALCSSIIAFIVPVQFRKWSVQSKIDDRFMLIYDEILPPNSFVFNGKEFSARCCFQIWSKYSLSGYSDMRLREKPRTSHPDFDLYQYNNTVAARKYFEYPWDFCVPRQGYYDYSKVITNRKDCKYNIQYIFFKINNPEAAKIFELFDFASLALKNTTIPGFGKADVIQEYERLEVQLKMKGSVSV